MLMLMLKFIGKYLLNYDDDDDESTHNVHTNKKKFTFFSNSLLNVIITKPFSSCSSCRHNLFFFLFVTDYLNP